MEKCYISLGKGICKTPAWLISFGNTKSPSLCTLSLETRNKTRKVRPHSAPWSSRKLYRIYNNNVRRLWSREGHLSYHNCFYTRLQLTRSISFEKQLHLVAFSDKPGILRPNSTGFSRDQFRRKSISIAVFLSYKDWCWLIE